MGNFFLHLVPLAACVPNGQSKVEAFDELVADFKQRLSRPFVKPVDGCAVD